MIFIHKKTSTGNLGLFVFTHWMTRLFHLRLLCEGDHARLLNWEISKRHNHMTSSDDLDFYF